MRQSSSSSYIAHLSGVLLLSLALVLLTNVYPSYGVHQFLPGSPRLFGSVPDSHPISFAGAEASPSFSSNGLTDVVQWDSFSLIVKGQRIFLQYVHYVMYIDRSSQTNYCHSSGEFHTFRLPVPSLWLDILQKIKAAGLNGISVYTHCALRYPVHLLKRPDNALLLLL